MYFDMAKSWILKAAKHCFMSLLSDPMLILDYNERILDGV